MTVAGRDDRIARATLDVLHAREGDALDAFGSHRCDRCGADDVELFWMIAPNGGLVQVDQTCGDLCRCIKTPACEGAPDLCGAPAGKPCQSGCPSSAADPPGSGSAPGIG